MNEGRLFGETKSAIIGYGISERIFDLALQEWIRVGAKVFDAAYAVSISDALESVHLAEIRIANPDKDHVWLYGNTPTLGNIKPWLLPELMASDKDRESWAIIGGISTQDLERIIWQRNEFRANNDWRNADKVRKWLQNRRISINDRKDGSVDWSVNLNSK